MTRLHRSLWGVLLIGAIATFTAAQFGGGRGRGGGGLGGFRGGRNASVDMPLPADRHGVPTWSVDPQFKSDVFTFVRLRYTSTNEPFADGTSRSGAGQGWQTDFPDSDLNFPFRLQQMTSLKVDPEGKRLDLTDPALFNYPFVYMLEVGRMSLTQEEIDALRRYLLNGGFLMVDDHWGLAEQRNFREQMERVFHDRKLEDLQLDHPIFHCVFDLKAFPQIPAIDVWRTQRRTFERYDDQDPHYRAIFDDKHRMMVIECANTDLGDGWEREGLDEEYFHIFSEKQAYPMGINIIFYALTH